MLTKYVSPLRALKDPPTNPPGAPHPPLICRPTTTPAQTLGRPPAHRPHNTTVLLDPGEPRNTADPTSPKGIRVDPPEGSERTARNPIYSREDKSPYGASRDRPPAVVSIPATPASTGDNVRRPRHVDNDELNEKAGQSTVAARIVHHVPWGGGRQPPRMT